MSMGGTGAKRLSLSLCMNLCFSPVHPLKNSALLTIVFFYAFNALNRAGNSLYLHDLDIN